ncbi:Uncharacterised protein [Acinetobacter baumannii]|nr:Uncharacterised protein [Acinetobacter baumannii]
MSSEKETMRCHCCGSINGGWLSGLNCQVSVVAPSSVIMANVRLPLSTVSFAQVPLWVLWRWRKASGSVSLFHSGRVL